MRAPRKFLRLNFCRNSYQRTLETIGGINLGLSHLSNKTRRAHMGYIYSKQTKNTIQCLSEMRI